ncbi:hypothetical protein A616_16960 [Brevibacillus brevis X23]|nr:hypothetical protein A616_16960 [Brevibacillus brevis X23]
MFLVKSERGNGTHIRRTDPAATLSNECLVIFYETVNQYEKVTTKEWNDLILYIRCLNEFYKNNPMISKMPNMPIIN